MSKKKSRVKNTFISIFSLLLGFIVGFVGEIFFSLPDSFVIPAKEIGTKYEYNVSSNISEGAIDVDVINSEDISFHFIELGNKYTGDCIYIKCGDTDILVDGGSRYDSIPYICNYVDSYMNDDCLDYIIVTHAHQDHYAGYATPNSNIDSIFDHYSQHGKYGKSTGLIIDFAQTKQKSTSKMYGYYLNERSQAVVDGAKHFTALECFNNNNDSANKSLNEKSANRYYKIGKDSQNNDILLQILYTMYYDNPNAETENDNSICFQIIQGTKKYLFTGDLESKGEASLVESAANNLGKVELYKAGHHGSKTSSSEALLNIIQPEIVVVCCCAGSSEYTSNNNNQFPTQDFINRVSIWTDRIYVTTLCTDYKAAQFESFNGTIVVSSKGSTATSLFCSNNTTMLKDSKWFEENRTLPENAKITA